MSDRQKDRQIAGIASHALENHFEISDLQKSSTVLLFSHYVPTQTDEVMLYHGVPNSTCSNVSFHLIFVFSSNKSPPLFMVQIHPKLPITLKF